MACCSGQAQGNFSRQRTCHEATAIITGSSQQVQGQQAPTLHQLQAARLCVLIRSMQSAWEGVGESTAGSQQQAVPAGAADGSAVPTAWNASHFEPAKWASFEPSVRFSMALHPT